MITTCVFLILGLIVLVYGAEYLIRGASNLARTMGMSTLMIGLTIVAFGTSAPELFVSVDAALKGNADVAIGNVVGSNICNILGIIGVSAMLAPVMPSKAVMRREMPLMLATMLAFFLVSLNGIVSRLEGALLFLGIVSYLGMNYLLVKRRRLAASLEHIAEPELPDDDGSGPFRNLFYIAAGLVGMIVGAGWIVESATFIATALEVSDLVISITVVAIGTSLPELATTVVAAKRGQADLAVGNAIGSNLFNVLCVIGITAFIRPLKVSSSAITFDMPFMLCACALVWLLMKVRVPLKRGEGIAFIAIYLGYVAYLFFGMKG